MHRFRRSWVSALRCEGRARLPWKRCIKVRAMRCELCSATVRLERSTDGARSDTIQLAAAGAGGVTTTAAEPSGAALVGAEDCC
jgi:hypothetical protein